MQCKLCSEIFDKIHDIGFHLASKHHLPYKTDVKSDFLSTFRLIDMKCLVCIETLKDFRSLALHMNSEHSNKCFECDYCHTKFNIKRVLQEHVRNNHREEYKCHKCLKTFKFHAELIRHKKKDHISKCNLCLSAFPSLKIRLKHMKDEHDLVRGGTCSFCGKVYNNKNALLDHATKCTVGEQNQSEEMEIVTGSEDTKYTVRAIRTGIAYIINNTAIIPFKISHGKFRCFYCTKEFDKCVDLRSHTNSDHPVCDVKLKAMKLKGLCPSKGMKIKIDTSSLNCNLCPEQAIDFGSLVAHLDTIHKGNLGNCVEYFQPFQLIHDRFPCTWCDNEFRHFHTLLKHVNKEHTGNRFLCIYCGKPFPNGITLRSHVIRTHNEQKFRRKCTICEQEFICQSDMNEHMGRAHRKKTIKCPQCLEKFVSHYAKDLHIVKVHNGGHKCTYCGVVFPKYCRLTNHIRRLHLNEKSVKCILCEKTFFDARRLRNHMVIHVGEKNFACDYCGKKFLRKKNLVGHVRLHLKKASQFHSVKSQGGYLY